MASLLGPLEDHDFLVDWRNVTIKLSTSDVAWLVIEILKHKTLVKKVAILGQSSEFDRAKFIRLCARANKRDIEVFTSHEDAIAWLMPATELKL